MPKILVIDDDDSIRNTILELLDNANFETIGAANGKIGILLAQEESPDLILCDISMPKMDGYEVLLQLQSHAVTASIPFIFLTAKDERAAFRQGMQLGADDYLTKPFAPDELLSAIAGRLKKYSTITQVYNDILQETAQKLDYSAHYDPLTELPNRLSLRERFDEVLGQLEIYNDNPNGSTSYLIPVLYLNLDRFNRLNETLGYAYGDYLLNSVAQRLKDCLNTHEVLARLDADEFAVILSPTTDEQVIEKTAKTILETLQKPFHLEEHEVFVTGSIGISLYPQDQKEIEGLLQKANKAMQISKQQGGNRYEFYNSTFSHSSYEQLTLETDLRYALERQELEVYYQPQVSLHNSKIVGAEALLRWRHPHRGFISPAQFIPIAEETGLITSIGNWMITQACQQTKLWQENGMKHLRVAVNLSSRQFNNFSLHEKLVSILEETQLKPESLELELTESLLVANPKVATQIMNALKDIGVKISIDDFGTGYSSLSYLERFPFDILKIDRSFVQNIHNNPKNAAITTAIIHLAHQLNLKVIAEGVETEAELDFLAENQCDEIQGYYFSPPLPASEFKKLADNYPG